MNVDLSFLNDVKRVAVAVSGGGDSMALAHMLMQYTQEAAQPIEIQLLSVDHDLRDHSRAEAEQVKNWVTHWPNVTHEILTWQGTKPDQGRMDAARQARYNLMQNYCMTHNITVLCTGHHQDDQAETLLIRLTCGSGLDGLAGMRVFQKLNDTLTLWRPLLSLSHEDLLAYCRKHDVPWVEDPTNAKQDYTRNRLRASRDILNAEGLSAKRLGVTAARLSRASDALKMLAENLSDKATQEKTDETQHFDYSLLISAPEELRIRVLQNAINKLGETSSAYGPRLEKLEGVVKNLFETKDKHTETLGGCVLSVDPARSILIVRAEKTKNA